jgi:hypothetical protein
MRPVHFGEASIAGTRLTLFSHDKLDRLFTVVKFWIDKVSGVALDLETGVPLTRSKTRKAESILLHIPIEEENELRSTR